MIKLSCCHKLSHFQIDTFSNLNMKSQDVRKQFLDFRFHVLVNDLLEFQNRECLAEVQKLKNQTTPKPIKTA